MVSSDSEVFWQVRELGALPIAEPATLSGLNDGLTFGVRYLARRVGCDEVVIFPADVPLVRPMDVCTVVNALGGSGAAGGAGAGGRQRDECARTAAAGGDPDAVRGRQRERLTGRRPRRRGRTSSSWRWSGWCLTSMRRATWRRWRRAASARRRAGGSTRGRRTARRSRGADATWPTPLRVMTFNIRGFYHPDDGANRGSTARR